MTDIFKMWERTSYELEKIQSNVMTANEEFKLLEHRKGPIYLSSFELDNSLVISGMFNELLNYYSSIRKYLYTYKKSL